MGAFLCYIFSFKSVRFNRSRRYSKSRNLSPANFFISLAVRDALERISTSFLFSRKNFSTGKKSPCGIYEFLRRRKIKPRISDTCPSGIYRVSRNQYSNQEIFFPHKKDLRRQYKHLFAYAIL